MATDVFDDTAPIHKDAAENAAKVKAKAEQKATEDEDAAVAAFESVVKAAAAALNWHKKYKRWRIKKQSKQEKNTKEYWQQLI